MRRWVPILIGLVILAFGIGFLSLAFNDNFRIANNNLGRFVNIRNNGEIVNIGSNGIEVIDGEDYVNVSWRGIQVRDGEDLVDISWNGIHVQEDGKTKVNIGGNWNWFSGLRFNSSDYITTDIDEERFVEIDGISDINVSSSIVSIKVTSQDRDDIRVCYYGTMKSNVVPELKIDKSFSTLNIKLETNNSHNYSTIYNDVVLEVFVPEFYKDNFHLSSASGTISMKDLIGNVFNASTSSGNISMDDIDGKSLKLSTSSGSIGLEGIEADLLDLSTSSGSIKAEYTIGEIQASTSSGSILLDIKEVDGDMELSTASGSISIQLPQDANYKIKGSSSSGRYTPSRSMAVSTNEKGKFKATIGAGDNLIDISTSSGSVSFSE